MLPMKRDGLSNILRIALLGTSVDMSALIYAVNDDYVPAKVYGITKVLCQLINSFNRNANDRSMASKVAAIA